MRTLDETGVIEALVDSELRQTIVEWLSTRRPPVALGRVADAVTDAHGVSDDIAMLRLHHIHLPKLTQLGLVAYDATDQRVDDYSPERLAEVLEEFTSLFSVGGRAEKSGERPTGIPTNEADIRPESAVEEPEPDGGYVEVPPPRGDDEN